MKLTLLDGGMGRELKRIGAPFRQPEWSALALIEAPNTVDQVHQTFVEAGADVITTNNYAVAPFHLGQERFATRGRELTELAGQLARTVATRATRAVQVAGSIPPLYGSYRADWFDADAAQRELPMVVQALQNYVDIWLAETMSSIAEFQAILAALESLDQMHQNKPLWASFTIADQWQNGQAVLRSGETIEAALSAVLESPAQAVLFNCSQPEYIDRAVRVCADFLTTSTTDIAFGAYANAFTARTEPRQANEGLSKLRDELTPELYRDEFVHQWVYYGARIIGGCCGLGPQHIGALRRWIDQR